MESVLGIGAPVFAIFFLTPSEASPAREVSTGAIAITMASGGVLFVALLAHIFLAPYRQRNEARKELQEQLGAITQFTNRRWYFRLNEIRYDKRRS